MNTFSPDNYHHYKLKCSYRGTRYLGWQIQPPPALTIQGEINRALSQIAKCPLDKLQTAGSGRTDAGVHALGQIIRADIPLKIVPESLLRAMNSFLPLDIRILSAEITQLGFRPIQDAIKKEYIYVFCLNQKVTNPLSSELVHAYPFPLNIELMREASKLFLGEHDFHNYFCTGTPVHSTTRTILNISLEKHQSTGHWSNLVDEYYVLSVCGNGFLKQMVRLIMGALWEVGRGKTSIEHIKQSLSKAEAKKPPVAPPEGLYLKEVFYPDN